MTRVQSLSPKPGVRICTNGMLAEDAVLADHVPAHGRVLAVDVEDAATPICGSAGAGRSGRRAGGRAPIRARDCRPAARRTSAPRRRDCGRCSSRRSPSCRPWRSSRRRSARPCRRRAWRAVPRPPWKRGRLSGSGVPRRRPVKPATMSVPKRCALSISVSQPARVSRSSGWSSSGLPNMPRARP